MQLKVPRSESHPLGSRPCGARKDDPRHVQGVRARDRVIVQERRLSESLQGKSGLAQLRDLLAKGHGRPRAPRIQHRHERLEGDGRIDSRSGQIQQDLLEHAELLRTFDLLPVSARRGSRQRGAGIRVHRT